MGVLWAHTGTTGCALLYYERLNTTLDMVSAAFSCFLRAVKSEILHS